MNKVPCRLWTGLVNNKSVADLVADSFAENKAQPLLVFREPKNAARPLQSFSGLTRPEVGSRENYPLLEARLFYPGGLLHLLTAGENTRWAAWLAAGEKNNVSSLDWLPALAEENPVEKLDLVEQQRDILLRHASDRDYSGLAKVENLSKVKAFEYFQGTSLRWWRIESHG